MQLHFPESQRGYAPEITLPPKIIESAVDFATSGQPVWRSKIHTERFIMRSWSRVPSFPFLLSRVCLWVHYFVDADRSSFFWSHALVAIHFWKTNHVYVLIYKIRGFFLTLAKLANVSAKTLINLQIKVRLLRTGSWCLHFHRLSSLFSWECMSSLLPPTWRSPGKATQARASF